MITEMLERPVAASTVDLDLDVRIVTASPMVPAPLNSVGNEYNTDDEEARDASL